MKIDKKRIEGVALGLLTLSLICTASLTGKTIKTEENIVETEQTEKVGSNTAGVYEAMKAAQAKMFTAGVEQVRSDVVAISESDGDGSATGEASDEDDDSSDTDPWSEDDFSDIDEDSEEEDYSYLIDVEALDTRTVESKGGDGLDVSGAVCKHSSWYNQGMTTASDYLNIRESKSAKSKILGKMNADTVVKIVKYNKDWSKVKADDVKGYVATRYLIVGDAAYENFLDKCEEMVVVSADDVNIRAKASEDAKVIGIADTGDLFIYNTKAKAVDGWLAVKTDDGKGYISTDYCEITRIKGEVVTPEEEAERAEAERKAREEEIKKIQEEGGFVSGLSDNVTVTYHDPYIATDEERDLLAAIIYCEASPYSYDGQVAVAAVVLNRVRSGHYPNSIYDVIYQKYQFGPAGSGTVAKVIKNKTATKSNYQAADEALYGADPTGGLLHFNSSRARKDGINIGGNVFY